ncbi:putative transposase DNA-binding domain-containing protein [Lipomyces kononenkoae]|uniref:Transposase DNA-binding domain-containing protein n=1 Tax=Lipomyces kononenkoae TaxID=34357 RepID=A0ACC3T8F6_LIPKO
MSQQTTNQHRPQPFWDANSAQVSGQLWLPPSSIPANEWKDIDRGWGTCRIWSSEAVIHHQFQLPLAAGEEGPAQGLVVAQEQPATKARKYRLYPTAAEAQILQKWIAAASWTFNECLRAIKSEGPRISKKELRARAINKDAIASSKMAWLEETPYDIRDAAMDDVLKAYKAGAARYKKDNKPYHIRYRSHQNCFQESIVIRSKHWQKRSGKHAFLRRMNCEFGERLPDTLPHDSRLVRERLTGHFYLCVPGPLEVVDTPDPAGVRSVISLDPGVRTFMTGYTPGGVVIELGKADIGHIYRLCHRLDALQSRWSVTGLAHKKKWRMKRAAAMIRRRIRNLVDDLHCRTAKYLCSSYNVVILPKFETQQMVTGRGRRRIRSKTARAMATWAHYRFQQRLLNKAREYPWCRVVLVSEAHTSKTCGRCGRLNNVGGSKVFSCSHCGFVCDRDVNGARNILVRYCTKIARGESVTD